SLHCRNTCQRYPCSGTPSGVAGLADLRHGGHNRRVATSHRTGGRPAGRSVKSGRFPRRWSLDIAPIAAARPRATNNAGMETRTRSGPEGGHPNRRLAAGGFTFIELMIVVL